MASEMLSHEEQLSARGKPVAHPDKERSVRVLVFEDDPERKPRLYVCTGCGSGHSPAIYACREEEAHKAALDAATNCYTCKTHNVCQDCGAQCGKHWLVCETCRQKRMLAKREHVSPAEVDYCFSLDGDTFYSDPIDAAEAGEQWVSPALPLRTFRIDPDSILEGLLEDHFEDCSEHDLNGVEALLAAIAAFNDAQTSGTYDRDDKRVCFVGDLAPAADAGESDIPSHTASQGETKP